MKDKQKSYFPGVDFKLLFPFLMFVTLLSAARGNWFGLISREVPEFISLQFTETETVTWFLRLRHKMASATITK